MDRMGLLALVLAALLLWSSMGRIEGFTSEQADVTKTKQVYVAKSCTGGRGVFAGGDISKGDLIEACPMLVDVQDTINRGVISDYLFKVDDQKAGLAMGNCSLFNHHDQPNASWRVDPKRELLMVTATKDIKQGQEIFISYGSGYWKTRTYDKRLCK